MSTRTCHSLPGVLHQRFEHHLEHRHHSIQQAARRSQPLLFFFFLMKTQSQHPLCKDLCSRRGFLTHISRREANMLLVCFQVSCKWRENERCIQWWQQHDLLWCWVFCFVWFLSSSAACSLHIALSADYYSLVFSCWSFFSFFSTLSATFFPMQSNQDKEFTHWLFVEAL